MTTVGMDAGCRLDVRLDGTRRFIDMNVAAACNITRIRFTHFIVDSFTHALTCMHVEYCS